MGVVLAVVDRQKYQILLRLQKGLVSEKSGLVGIADFTLGECFGIFLGNAHPTNYSRAWCVNQSKACFLAPDY
jgi:hypothetical protein